MDSAILAKLGGALIVGGAGMGIPAYLSHRANPVGDEPGPGSKYRDRMDHTLDEVFQSLRLFLAAIPLGVALLLAAGIWWAIGG